MFLEWISYFSYPCCIFHQSQNYPFNIVATNVRVIGMDAVELNSITKVSTKIKQS